jgi:hypothetical protein
VAVAANAVRHGLTAETVVVALEDIEDYQASKRLSSQITTPEAEERELVRPPFSASRPPAAPRFGTSALRSGGWSHYHLAVLCDASEL